MQFNESFHEECMNEFTSCLDLFLPNNDTWFQWSFSIVPEWKINLNSLFDVIFYQFAAA